MEPFERDGTAMAIFDEFRIVTKSIQRFGREVKRILSTVKTVEFQIGKQVATGTVYGFHSPEQLDGMVVKVDDETARRMPAWRLSDRQGYSCCRVEWREIIRKVD